VFFKSQAITCSLPVRSPPVLPAQTKNRNETETAQPETSLFHLFACSAHCLFSPAQPETKHQPVRSFVPFKLRPSVRSSVRSVRLKTSTVRSCRHWFVQAQPAPPSFSPFQFETACLFVPVRSSVRSPARACSSFTSLRKQNSPTVQPVRSVRSPFVCCPACSFVRCCF
jgi:hypothetical protein